MTLAAVPHIKICFSFALFLFFFRSICMPAGGKSPAYSGKKVCIHTRIYTYIIVLWIKGTLSWRIAHSIEGAIAQSRNVSTYTYPTYTIYVGTYIWNNIRLLLSCVPYKNSSRSFHYLSFSLLFFSFCAYMTSRCVRIITYRQGKHFAHEVSRWFFCGEIQ